MLPNATLKDNSTTLSFSNSQTDISQKFNPKTGQIMIMMQRFQVETPFLIANIPISILKTSTIRPNTKTRH